MIRFLKIMATVFALALVTQGCGVVVGDDDDFHHHREHWGPHERGEHGHSSLEQAPRYARQMDENLQSEN